MNVNPEKFRTMDQVLINYLNEHPDIEERWLLEQTLHTGPTRRMIFDFLPFEPHASVLDAGTGFGAFPLELASQIPVHVHGVDIDVAKLEVAKTIRRQLQDQSFFHQDTHVEFDAGDLYSLPYEDNHFDFVTTRFVYQHLHDPLSVSLEFFRVTRPGGYVCVVDIDEQFSTSYPQDSQPLAQLHEAFCEVQKLRGGDRFVGRKLATYLDNAGFTVQATAIQPQTYFGQSEMGDWNHQFTVYRLYSVKDEIVSNGIMEGDEFDRCLNALYESNDRPQFTSVGQVVVIARK